MNHVSGHALSPALGTGGGGLPPQRIWAAPNLIPAGKRNRVGSPIASRLATSRQQATTAVRGLRPAGGGLLICHSRAPDRIATAIDGRAGWRLAAGPECGNRTGIHSCDHTGSDCVQSFHARNHVPHVGRSRVFAS